MAITATIAKQTVYGNTHVVFADLNLGTYATGGISLTAPDLGYSDALVPEFVAAEPSAGLIFEYDHSAHKLMALYPSGGSAVPSSVADPTVAVPSGATGVTSSAAQPTLTVTAGRGKEVKASTDLSDITVRALVVLA